MSLRTMICAAFLSLSLLSPVKPAEPRYGEKGGLDQALNFVKLGRTGEAVRLLTDLKSAQAKALRADLIGKDTPEARARGLTRFNPELAQQLGREALPELLKQAKSDTVSSRLLGAIYFWGIGTEPDRPLGFRLWRDAASEGDSGAMATLALCYRDGLGVDQDKESAFDWAKKSSDGGHPRGMNLLAEFYHFGELAPKNPLLASMLWEKSAKLGYIDSMMRCADLAFDRAMKTLRGGNAAAANKYFRSYADWIDKAATADALAMLKKGDLYRVGLEPAVPRDQALSFRSYSEAATSELTLPLASLACCLYTGLSVRPNIARADELLKESVAAAARDNFQDRKQLEEIASMPDPESRKEALAAFLQWDVKKEVRGQEGVGRQENTAATNDQRSPSFSPPRKRRYKSQAAQRQANINIINGMLQDALIADEQAKAAQYQLMTPGPPRSQQSHYCGAPTLDGTPCQRLVIGPGYCYQHR
jgi:TPR repeat protein